MAGAVYVPMRGELFTAVRGEGAWLESTRGVGRVAAPGESRHPRLDLRADSAPLPARACRSTRRWSRPGSATGRSGGRCRARWWRRCCPGSATSGGTGSASVDLCAVAAGRLDGYYERGLNYWDYAAGALIAAEAGAVVGRLQGRAAEPSMTVAAGPGLFGPLRDALAELDAERDG